MTNNTANVRRCSALYILGVIAAAAVGALSYPHWLSGLASFSRPARADLQVSTPATVRVYWEDPVRDPQACLEIRAVPTVESYSFQLPRSKRHWPQIKFVADVPNALTVPSMECDGQWLLKTGDNGFLRPWEFWSVNATAMLVAAVFAWMLALIFALAVRIGCEREPGFGVQCSLAALLALFAAFFWTAVFFPALMSEDSVVQWRQAVTGQYSNWHPPIMALLMHATQRVTSSPALFTFVQGTVFWGAIFAALFVAVRSPRLRLVSYAVMLANPALWTCSAVLWKDVWTAAFTAMAIGPLIRAMRRSSAFELAAGTLCIAAAACFRQNAASLAIAPVLVGALFLWRSRGIAGRIARAVLVLLLAVAPARVLDQWPGVADQKALFTAQFYLPTYVGVACRLDRAGADYAAERERFDAVFGAGKLDELVNAYEPASGNCVLYIYSSEPPILPIERIAEHRSFAMASALRVAATHPVLFLRHKARIVSNILQVPTVFNAYHRGIRPNDFGLGEQSLLPLAMDVVYRLLSAVQESVLFRHYVFVVALCLLLGVGWKRQDEASWVTALLGLSYVLGVVAVDAHPDWRYLLPSYLCAWVGLLSLLSGLARRGSSEGRPSAA